MGSSKTLLKIALGASLLCSNALTACDDSNDNSKPSEAAGKSGGSTKAGKGGSSGGTAKAGKGGSGEADEAGSSAAAGKAGSSGAAGKGGSGASAGSSAGDCTGDKDCYACAPSKNEEFLNHCTEAMCSPYDNSKLTKIKDGKLPVIP